MSDRDPIIDALRYARNALGVTQSQLAAVMFVQQSTISDLERVGGNPTLGTLRRWCEALGFELRLVPTGLSPAPPALVHVWDELTQLQQAPPPARSIRPIRVPATWSEGDFNWEGR